MNVIFLVYVKGAVRSKKIIIKGGGKMYKYNSRGIYNTVCHIKRREKKETERVNNDISCRR